jgi:hypothetical protein
VTLGGPCSCDRVVTGDTDTTPCPPLPLSEPTTRTAMAGLIGPRVRCVFAVAVASWVLGNRPGHPTGTARPPASVWRGIAAPQSGAGGRYA